MQQFFPHRVVNACDSLRLFASGSDVPSSDPLKYTRPIPDPYRESLKAHVRVLDEECAKLRFKASRDTLASMMDVLNDPQGLLQSVVDDAKDVEGRIVSELRYTTCFALEGETEDLFRADEVFGKAVAAKFTGASHDIAEAAKCLALDRGTACVMHLQRVLECGLDALGKAVGITKPLRDWGKFVTDIGDALERKFKASGARTPDEQFYSEAHVTFDAVRRAWRNPTMHVEKTYTTDQAREILNTSRSFMKHIASRLDE